MSFRHIDATDEKGHFIKLVNGSRFYYQPDKLGNARDRAIEAAGEAQAAWEAALTKRLGRPLTDAELRGKFNHAPATQNEKAEHREIMSRLTPAPDPLAEQIAAAREAVRRDERKGMTPNQRALDSLLHDKAERDRQPPPTDPRIEAATRHAQAAYDAAARDPLSSQKLLLEREQLLALSRIDPDAYAKADTAWRGVQAKERADVRRELQRRQDATLADERAILSAGYTASRTSIPAPVEVDTREPEPPADPLVSSLAPEHARIGVALARTPEDRARAQETLDNLQSGKLSVEDYWASTDQPG